MALPEAKFLRRAGFLKHNLWVTQYRNDEIFPGGEFPNQNPRIHEGLPTWVKKDRSLEETNIVLWYYLAALNFLEYSIIHRRLKTCITYLISTFLELFLHPQVRVRAHPYPKAGRLACDASGAYRLHAHGTSSEP